MPEQDIYKLVEQLNKNKSISSDSKIDDIYNLLDEVRKTPNPTSSTVKKPNIEQTKLGDYKDQVKPCVKPAFPTMIMPYEKRSECFINILQAVEYGDNNSAYKQGHEDALSKYYTAANHNAKDLYVVEGQVNDEINICRNNISGNYQKGYYDGLEYVAKALERSKQLLAKEIFNKLEKELS